MNRKIDIESAIENAREAVSLLNKNADDREVFLCIEELVLSDEMYNHLSISDLKMLIERIFLALRRDLYILEPLSKRKNVSEIMVNGKDEIFIDVAGRVERVNVCFESNKALLDVIRRIVSGVDREINELSPIVDARLPDGSRVNAVHENIALNGPVLTIRKFPEKGYRMQDLIEFETISEECAEYLKILVESGYNIFVSGGTSSGKTTFLNVLCEFIPKNERLVIIEDSAELAIRGRENVVRMECRKANSEGIGKVDMVDLIRTSLRMRSDRIIVGEVRGGEVVDMINAMNTGHDGSLSTGHGNSIGGMLRRLESMFLQEAGFPLDAVRTQIAEGIDIMIHLGRLKDGTRKVLEVSELTGVSGDEYCLNRLFSYRPGTGLIRTGYRLQNRFKLELTGSKYADKL